MVLVSRADEFIQSDAGVLLRRALTADEITESSRAHGHPDPCTVAGKLAIKEAVFKTFQTTQAMVPWLTIQTRKSAGGWPEVTLVGRARKLAGDAGLRGRISVSVSSAGAFVVAVAMATFHEQEILDGGATHFQ